MGSSASVVIEDSSEFLYRNSSTDESGIDINLAYTSDGTDKTSNMTDDTDQVIELLEDTCRQMLCDKSTSMAEEANNFAGDRDHLIAQAKYAWDRAIAIYDNYTTFADDVIAQILAQGIDRICQQKIQWARTAGSSLNCLVADLEIRAHEELSRILLAERQRWNKDATEEETKAIVYAFDRELAARLEPTKAALDGASSFLQILRGAKSNTENKRAVGETMHLSRRIVEAKGRYWMRASSISADEGTYVSQVNDNRALVNAAAGLVG